MVARSTAAIARSRRSGDRAGRDQGFALEVQIAGDDRQDIVEIVGDAAGQLTDHLHLLGLEQLGLDRPALGAVGVNGHEAARRRIAAHFDHPTLGAGEISYWRVREAGVS